MRSKTDDGAFAAAVGDEAAIEFRNDGDAVRADLAGDVAENLAGVGIDGLGMGGAGDKETVIGGVHGDVVPATFAADGEGARDGE